VLRNKYPLLVEQNEVKRLLSRGTSARASSRYLSDLHDDSADGCREISARTLLVSDELSKSNNTRVALWCSKER